MVSLRDGVAPLFRGIPRKTQNTRKFSTSRNNQENHGNTLFWNSVMFAFYSVMFFVQCIQARAKPEAESKPSACEQCFPWEEIRSMTKVGWQEANKGATPSVMPAAPFFLLHTFAELQHIPRPLNTQCRLHRLQPQIKSHPRRRRPFVLKPARLQRYHLKICPLFPRFQIDHR